MSTLSRWMPPLPRQPIGAGGYALLGLIGAGLLAAIVFSTSGRVIIGGLFALGVVFHFWDDRRLRRLALTRPGEDLCTFARAFDRRATDFWAVRAIYDELRPYCRFRGGQLPLRPSDTLKGVLHIDAEDVWYMARDATLRAGRLFTNLEANPQYSHLTTVGDLVAFVQFQPKVQQPAA